jgi:hypothetical protein
MSARSLRQPFALVAVLAMLLSGLSAVGAHGSDPGDPVANQQQVAFTPVRADADPAENTVAAGYAGEMLSVRAVDVGRRSAEPTIGVQSDGTAYYAAANFDSAANVSAGPATVNGLARTEILRSDDGGITWASVEPTVPVAKSLPPGGLDPYVWVDPGTDRVFSADLVACGYLKSSDDKGETWTSSLAACGDSVDHQTLFGGPRPEGMALPQVGDYPNVLYYCTNRILDSRCGRSVDGGLTWITTATPAYLGFDPAAGGMCNGLHGHGIVDPDGRVILPKGHCGNPYVAISEDGGDTWEQVKVSDKLSGTPIVPVLRYAGTFAHTSVASDEAGNLYYVWPDEDMRPWLSVSRDHGRTWETPLLIAPPGVTETNFPTVDAGSEGNVAITFVGSAGQTPGAAGGGDPTRPWNYYVLASTNALDDSPLFVSTTANDPADPIHRGDCFSRCGGMYDFIDVVVGPAGDIWATASDTCVSAGCRRDGGRMDPGVGVGLAITQVSGPVLRGDDGGDPDGDVAAPSLPGKRVGQVDKRPPGRP